MAVEIKYVVVRKGEVKMTFASKKEADGKNQSREGCLIARTHLHSGDVSLPFPRMMLRKV